MVEALTCVPLEDAVYQPAKALPVFVGSGKIPTVVPSCFSTEFGETEPPFALREIV
jgi:hypothetical protein